MKKTLLLFFILHLMIAWVAIQKGSASKTDESKAGSFSFSIDVSKKESPVLLNMSGKKGLSFN